MINYDLQKIRAIVFDLDGVLSAETISLGIDGTPLRTVNIKDGYAIQLAVKMGLRIAIISGCKIEAVRVRYEGLGMQDIYLGAAVKIKTYEEFVVGCPVCPKDACPEVREASCYVSHHKGGYGCARDVIEQTLRAQQLWMKEKKAFGW